MSKITTWDCIKNCGACCKLEPHERSEALAVLSPEDQELFLSMVLSDGWCCHYDKISRKCKIYLVRPSFCNVKNLARIFNVPEEKKNDFAIECCKNQISHIYGKRSKEIKRFKRHIEG